jgi:hypothetical protein
MRKLLRELLKISIIFLIVQQFFSWHSFKTFPKEEIDARFEPLTGKFMVWLEFHQKIDPIFTEEYLLGQGENGTKHAQP